MTSKIVVNNIEADAGVSTVTFGSEISASTFNGNIVGTSATFSGNVNVAGVLTYEDVTSVDAIGLSTFQNGIHVTGGSVGIGTNNPARLLSVMSASGPILELGTYASGANPSIFLHEGTTGSTINGGGLVYDAVNNLLNIVCGNTIETTRMTIKRSDGNVGIGTDNPAAKLHVKSVIRVDGSTNPYIVLNDGTNTGYIQIADGKLDLNHNGSISFAPGGGVKATINTSGNLVFSGSGQGIDFSAASGSAAGSTSALLDDYEEGTFTVTMQYYNSGWVDATFSNTPYTTGYYVKVGNLCTAYYYSTDFQLNVGNGTGALFIGLPFTAANVTQGYAAGTVSHVTCFQQTNQNLYIGPNTSYVVPIQSNSTSLSTWNNTANVYIMWSVTYRTN